MVLWCFVTPRVSRSWQHHVSLFRETREIIPTKVTCADMFITCLAQCKELQSRYHPWCLVCLTWCGGWSPWWFQLQRFHSWMPPWTPASAATWTSPFKLKDTSMTGAKMWVPRPRFPRLLSCRCSRVASRKQHHRPVARSFQLSSGCVTWMDHRWVVLEVHPAGPWGAVSSLSEPVGTGVHETDPWKCVGCKPDRSTDSIRSLGNFCCDPTQHRTKLGVGPSAFSHQSRGERCCLCPDGGASGTLQCANHSHGPSTHHHYSWTTFRCHEVDQISHLLSRCISREPGILEFGRHFASRPLWCSLELQSVVDSKSDW